MRESFDLTICGGSVIDGTGAAPFVADIGIKDGRIAAIGSIAQSGDETIDATGLFITPGFVDIHTHYDGQVTWDRQLAPSCFHGVTTAVIGNCGVGFAPCKPQDRDALIRLMDGVEDIPHAILAEGLSWEWESFEDFLDLLASRTYDMDILAYVPHAALRVFVMGERATRIEPATPDDIAQMCALFARALDAGAAGLATSRTLFHKSSDGQPMPTTDASEAELLALARVMRERDKGVFQIVEDINLPEANLDHARRIATESGRPLTFSMGTSNNGVLKWPQFLEELGAANADGLVMKGQIIPRAIGMMLGFELTLNPFYTTPTYEKLAALPLDARAKELRKPDVRAAILAEKVDENPKLPLGRVVQNFGDMFQLGNPPDYEQRPENTIAARAKAAGVSPQELAYDLMLEEGGRGRLYLALANLRDGSLDAVGQMLRHPDIVLGLGDGGAHVGTICDASYSTYALMHWARDRVEGRFPVETIVHKMTGATAAIMGLKDRGMIAIGKQADLNVIDLARLSLHAPEIHYDLPAGGKRLIQRATGYTATIKSGRVIYRGGEPTGELPGRLVRV
jgi:N-acyl-D-amino-acid deacylase